MYQISNEQIDFILNDISARGVEMESLQQNLLDHICCIIEQELEENGDFEHFYRQTVERFYKSDLWEIEEETLRLLTFKDYYKMKKIMIMSGGISTLALASGLIFKFMHWPGANVQIVLGIVLASLVFLPLLFTLRVREQQTLRDKGIIAIGSLCGILISLHVLFKVMHWPFANMLGTISMFLLILVFLPVYFISGMRNPDTKVNTIVSSFLILLGCGLILTLVRSPKSTELQNIRLTESFIRSDELLQKQILLMPAKSDSSEKLKQINELSAQLISACEQLKGIMLESETGFKHINMSDIRKGARISDSPIKDFFESNESAASQILYVSKLLNDYAGLCKEKNVSINIQAYLKALENLKEERILTALNSMIQIQLFVVQSKQELFNNS